MAIRKFGRWYFSGEDDRIIENCLREALESNETQQMALDKAASILGCQKKNVLNRMTNQGIMTKINAEFIQVPD